MAKQGTSPTIATFKTPEAYQEAMRPYWEAVGMFILRFADVEKMMFAVLCRMSEVELPVATAVFSGVRVNIAIDFINRIIDAKQAQFEADRLYGPPRPYNELSDAFTQLTHITRVRNDFVHEGLNMQTDGSLLFSNLLRAHIPDKIKEYNLSIGDLNKMTKDLDKIIEHLIFTLARDHVEHDRLASHTRRLHLPWQYKPNVQSRSPKKRHGSNQEQQRRPQS